VERTKVDIWPRLIEIIIEHILEWVVKLTFLPRNRLRLGRRPSV
jgi:hypothetical protein